MTTIIILVSRDFLLDRLFTRLNEMICYPDTSLLVLVDGPGKLFIKTRNLVNATKFNDRLCIHAFNQDIPVRNQGKRRIRIANLHNLAKTHLKNCDYVLLLEDDGIPPKNLLTQLHGWYTVHPKAGFISGLELGRWLTPYVGGWLFRPHDDPTELESVDLPDEPGLIEVDSAGFYGCLTRRENYTRYDHKPNQNWGPDLQYGLNLRRDGFKNYMDTSLVIDHYRENGTMINLDNTVPKKTHMKKHRGIFRFVHRINQKT